MKRLSITCLNSWARLKRCRVGISPPLITMSQRPCDHCVAPDRPTSLMRSTCSRGSPVMTCSGTGGSVMPDSSSNLVACSSAMRRASGTVNDRTGTTSRKAARILAISAFFPPPNVVFIEQPEMRLQLLDGVLGQVEFGPQVGGQAGQTLPVSVARGQIQLARVGLQRPGQPGQGVRVG